MKKYISPELVVVKLHTTRMLSMSKFDDVEIEDDSEILTKEVITGKSVWDEEW